MFEREVADHLGMDDAVFMPSGVMAQSIVIMICNEIQGGEGGGGSFVCHRTSHLLLHEKDSYSHLLSSTPLTVLTDEPMTPDDVRSHFAASEKKPSCVILEHPHRELGGALNDFSDLSEMKEVCGSEGVHLHLDGARIWEASGAGRTPKEIAGNFDSCYVSFYKGLGGQAGAMLLGKSDFVEKARVWLRRFGGNLHTLAPLWVSCYAGYRRNAKAPLAGLSFKDKAERLGLIVKTLKSDKIVGRTLDFHPPEPKVCMVHIIINYPRDICEKAEAEVFKSQSVHVFSRLRGGWRGDEQRTYFELNVGEGNGNIDVDTWRTAWRAFGEIAERMVQEGGEA